jgi:hypothetical protein
VEEEDGLDAVETAERDGQEGRWSTRGRGSCTEERERGSENDEKPSKRWTRGRDERAVEAPVAFPA